MKYVEAGGDVRGTSANAKYMGVIFQGTIDDAIAQAKAAPDHGVPSVNGRAELLTFLRVTQKAQTTLEAIDPLDVVQYGAPEAEPKPWDGLSPYSLEYAMKRWPHCFAFTAEHD